MDRPRVLLVVADASSDATARLLSTLERQCDVTVAPADDDVVGEFEVVFLISASPGPDLCKHIQAMRRTTESHAPILVVTRVRRPESLLAILHAGATDFVVAPYDPAEVLTRLRRLVDVARRSDPAVSRLMESLGLQSLVGQSGAFVEAVRDIPIIARSASSVLIRGETGTGKEVCARAIHYLSARASGPFVPVDCGAIPLDLIENELFGHERGAYTGAATAARGLVAEADGGTLFLDEIDCLPPHAQVKLLRLLQERTYRPLGSTRVHEADLRVVSASNANLAEAVRTNRLRRDLYYRLDVLQVHLPPLRERGEDILLLADHFLERQAIELGRTPPELSAGAARVLLNYDWPGNVRELEHVLERAAVLSGYGSVIRRADIRLAEAHDEAMPSSFREAKARAVRKFERAFLAKLLRVHSGNITHAAHAAGKDPRALRLLIRKHGIDVEQFR